MIIENGEHRSENAGAARVLHDVDTPSAETDEEVTVHRLGDRGVYSATIAGREIASLLYREEPGLIVVLSTEVDPDFRGRGIAGDLIADALDDIRSRGMKVRAVCPVVAAFMASSVLFSDLAV
ncbi:MAG TPA: GNAT family N-acetyltransferase [Microbacterium sp.]|nr:GNAT family N-acetyltransferase [Microbacterium sp.]